MKWTYMFKLVGVMVGITIMTGAMAFASDYYKVDPVHSAIVFRIQHLGVSDAFGRINDPSGFFTLDETNSGNNSVEISVNSKDVDTANEKRDKHLRSPDFFNIEDHPTIMFKSRKFEKTGPDAYRITGDLTMLGVTKPMTVSATRVGSGKDPWGGYRTGFTTEFTIKRSEFGMDYLMSGLGDEVHITVSIEGIRQVKSTGFKQN